MSGKTTTLIATVVCLLSARVDKVVGNGYYEDGYENYDDLLSCTTLNPCRNDRVYCGIESDDTNDTDVHHSCHIECIGQNSCHNLEMNVRLSANTSINDFQIIAQLHGSSNDSTSDGAATDDDHSDLDHLSGSPSSLWSEYSLDNSVIMVTVIDEYVQTELSSFFLSDELSLNVVCEEESCNHVNVTVVFENDIKTNTNDTGSNNDDNNYEYVKSVIDVSLNVSCLGNLACNSVNVTTPGTMSDGSSSNTAGVVSIYTRLVINCEGPSACGNSTINATMIDDFVITHSGNVIDTSIADFIDEAASSVGNIIILSHINRVWLNTSTIEPYATALTLFDITDIDWVFYDWFADGVACQFCAFYVDYSEGVCLQAGGFDLNQHYNNSDDTSQCVSYDDDESGHSFSYHWLTLANRADCNSENSGYCKNIKCKDQSDSGSDSVDRCIVKLDIFADDEGYTGTDLGWNLDCKGAKDCRVFCSAPFSCTSLNDFADGSSTDSNNVDLTVYLPSALATLPLRWLYDSSDNPSVARSSPLMYRDSNTVSDLYIYRTTEQYNKMKKSQSSSLIDLGSDDWVDDVIDFLSTLRSDVYSNVDSKMSLSGYHSLNIRCYQTYSCMLSVFDIFSISDGNISIECDGRLSCLFTKFNLTQLDTIPVNVSCGSLACVAGMVSVTDSPMSVLHYHSNDHLSTIWTDVYLNDVASAAITCAGQGSCVLVNLTVKSTVNDGTISVDCLQTGSCTRSLFKTKHAHFDSDDSNEVGLFVTCHASTDDNAQSGDTNSVSNLGPSCADTLIYCPTNYDEIDDNHKACEVNCHAAPNPVWNEYTESDIPSCYKVEVYTDDGVSQVDLECEVMVYSDEFGYSYVSSSCDDTHVKCGNHYHCECDMDVKKQSTGEHDVVCEGRCGTRDCSQKDSLSTNDVFVVVGLSLFVLFVAAIALLKFRQKRNINRNSDDNNNNVGHLGGDSYSHTPYTVDRNDGISDPLMA